MRLAAGVSLDRLFGKVKMAKTSPSRWHRLLQPTIFQPRPGRDYRPEISKTNVSSRLAVISDTLVHEPLGKGDEKIAKKHGHWPSCRRSMCWSETPLNHISARFLSKDIINCARCPAWKCLCRRDLKKWRMRTILITGAVEIWHRKSSSLLFSHSLRQKSRKLKLLSSSNHRIGLDI